MNFAKLGLGRTDLPSVVVMGVVYPALAASPVAMPWIMALAFALAVEWLLDSRLAERWRVDVLEEERLRSCSWWRLLRLSCSETAEAKEVRAVEV